VLIKIEDFSLAWRWISPSHGDFSKDTLGSVDLSRLNLQQPVWYLGKAEPMQCGYSP